MRAYQVATMARRLLIPAFVATLCLGCGGDDEGGKSCGGNGTFEYTAVGQHSTASVHTVLGSATSTLTFTSDTCTNGGDGGMDSIPSSVGTHDLTEPGSFLGAYIWVSLPGAGPHGAGFDALSGCNPCGSGSITVLESDAAHISGSFDMTAWLVDVGTYHADIKRQVSGTFDVKWK